MNAAMTSPPFVPSMATVAIAMTSTVAPLPPTPAPVAPAPADPLDHVRTLARAVAPGAWLDVRVLGVDPFAVHRVLREEGLTRAHTWVEVDEVGTDPAVPITVLRVTAVRAVEPR